MNVNDSRFHLLLGQDDWNRCLVRQDKGAVEPLPVWDATLNELSLQSKPILLAATPGESHLTLDARRSAAADRYGNIYWIDTDQSRIRVWSVGSDSESAFWPDGPMDCNFAHRPGGQGEFESLELEPENDQTFKTLAVTEDHYLVVAFAGQSRAGFLAFDLMAGGPPVETLWLASMPPFTPFDMAQRHGGGVWVLDRENTHLWELDRNLAIVKQTRDSTAPVAPEMDIFQPLEGAPREHLVSAFPTGIDLAALATAAGENIDPIAIEILDEANVLILGLNQSENQSRIFRLQRKDNNLSMIYKLDQPTYDFVLSKAYTHTATAASSSQLFVVAASGNQVLALDVTKETDAVTLSLSTKLFPLRLFGGRAVIKVKDTACYDSGLKTIRWVPIVQQPRASYYETAELVTPLFDGLELQCTWDRLMLDACIPSGSFIEVFCRAADEAVPCETSALKSPLDNAEFCEIIDPWVKQPKLYLRGDGAELPWLRADAIRSTQREAGIGTWELLLQKMHGRYLQIKLCFKGNGMVTPRLRALRAWYPRFSYSQRFLPAVYREDPIAGDFLERFLANMEGMSTMIEDRIVQIQSLFDPRCAPAEALEWLAGWFDLALDPAWEEWRRRLFIKHAMDFFRWRGTTHGIRLALAVAFENCLTDESFADPNPDTLHLQSIRIVETYQIRKVGAVVAGDAGRDDAGGFRIVKTGEQWSPQEDNEGLLKRYAEFMSDPQIAKQLNPFELAPPSDVAAQARWQQFCEQHLGFVPSIGAADRQNWQRYLALQVQPDDEQVLQTPNLMSAKYPSDWPKDSTIAAKWRAFSVLPNITRRQWQDFLTRRYRHITKLNMVYQTSWPAFDLIALPDFLPETKEAQTDWLQFEKHLLAITRTAHRFSVLLPVTSVTEDPAEMERHVQLARRIVELEKPAHTVFDVRFYWALNRIGEARLGLDTLLDVGSRAPQLLPDAVLGRVYLGASFAGGSKLPIDTDRYLLNH
ncbi:MAG: hypothetical protein DU489_01780 [Nitrosomonas sp.]|uniref:phage tail protein n=1 Tax=Nitrosomonas sp. TaxID=42353 RepID=UPI0032ED9D13